MGLLAQLQRQSFNSLPKVASRLTLLSLRLDWDLLPLWAASFLLLEELSAYSQAMKTRCTQRWLVLTRSLIMSFDARPHQSATSTADG